MRLVPAGAALHADLPKLPNTAAGQLRLLTGFPLRPTDWGGHRERAQDIVVGGSRQVGQWTYLQHLCGHSTAAIGPLHITGTAREIRISAAAAWLPKHFERIESFVNSERTTEHGTHVDGFMHALLQAVHHALPAQCRKLSVEETRRRIARGLHAVVSVQLFDPQYGAPTRDRLNTPEARDAVCTVLEPALRSLLATDARLHAHLLALLARARS